jgi:hypothetical protein
MHSGRRVMRGVGQKMKRWVSFSVVLLALLGGVIGWANHIESPLPLDARADSVVLEKSKRELTIYREGKPLKIYKVALGRVPVGPKSREGDKKTPEGSYTIDFRKTDSGYFRALHISYPSAVGCGEVRTASFAIRILLIIGIELSACC